MFSAVTGKKGGDMKTKLLKIIMRLAVVIALLMVGFVAGIPVGQSMGFATGSEWSLKQADILAREAGIVMPVNYKEGKFRVVVKQPRNLHKKAWKVADKHEEEMAYVNTGNRGLIDRVQLAQRISLLQ
jgi:hypothetical protein